MSERTAWCPDGKTRTVCEAQIEGGMGGPLPGAVFKIRRKLVQTRRGAVRGMEELKCEIS